MHYERGVHGDPELQILHLGALVPARSCVGSLALLLVMTAFQQALQLLAKAVLRPSTKAVWRTLHWCAAGKRADKVAVSGQPMGHRVGLPS